ncbi:MAG: 7-cyano-7-deazaguanine synthase QueC [Opitutales bacterium]|nr:7-cyano-7-deazaguanine synthase QueC [Opitutales bacterium]
MKAVVLFSGGLDSTVLTYHLLRENAELKLLSIDYGQRHQRELSASTQIALSLGLPHTILKLPMLAELLGGSALTDPSISLPEGHYAEESMKATVVPNRNMILLSLAAGHAISLQFNTVAYAAHAGDHTIYPDCRPEFADALDRTLKLADWSEITLHRPFVKWSKEDLVRRGKELAVPFEKTWSCYAGGELHCGKCGTCVERKEAFELVGLLDPTEYND